MKALVDNLPTVKLLWKALSGYELHNDTLYFIAEGAIMGNGLF